MRPTPFWTRWKKRKRKMGRKREPLLKTCCPSPSPCPTSPLPRLSRAASSLPPHAGAGLAAGDGGEGQIEPASIWEDRPTGTHPLNFLKPFGTPDAQPPHQSKVFEEEGGGSEGEGETFYRKFPLPPPISSYIPTAFFRAATSAGVSSRASPGFMTPRRKGPCATRTSRRMVRCRSRHMRRIWRFRP